LSFLIDTNVISELRKRDRANAHVQAWFRDVPDETIHLSALVIGELRQGIERRRRRDPQGAWHLERWLQALIERYADRILAVDSAVAERWGSLNVPDPLPVVDGLLAATALVHDLTLVTRNTADVERSGAALLNPFLPAAG
jgi:toxin FitB